MARPRDRSRDPYAEYGQDALKHWYMERLYGDLARHRGLLRHPLGEPLPLTPSERRNLRGLLLGESPKRIAEQFGLKPRALNVELTRSLYRYVKALAGRQGERMGGWQEIPQWLKRLGYYRGGDRGGDVAPVAQTPGGLGRLPRRFGPGLVGRSAELEQVLSLLQVDGGEGCVVISGAGGVGKTTLATEAAHRWAGDQGPQGGRVAFVSAKAEHLTGHGAVPHLQECRGLGPLLGAIAQQLDRVDFAEFAHLTDSADLATIETAIAELHRALAAGPPTLLVLDNLDPLLRREVQRAPLLAFLLDLPTPARAIVTARARLGIGAAVRLQPLPAAAATQLFERECERRRVPRVTMADRQILLEVAGGIPLLLTTAVGRLGLGHGAAPTVAWLRSLGGPAARLCFQEPLADGLPEAAIALVQALTLFEGPIPPEDVALVAGLDPTAPATVAGWQFLVERSWLSGDLGPGASVALVGALRQFGRGWLAQTPALERQLRDRWRTWGRTTADRHGWTDRLEWSESRTLDTYWPSLRPLMNWCLERRHIPDFLALWRALKGYLHVGGHWDDLCQGSQGLLKVALDQEDRTLAAIAHFERGWVETLYNEPKRLQAAVTDLRRAWHLKDPGDFHFAAEIAVNLGRLWIQLGKERQARFYLTEGEKLLARQVVDAHHGGRLYVQLLYYQGELHLRLKNYDRARSFYKDALEQSQAIGWERGSSYCLGCLGEVALAEGEWVQARQSLQASLSAAQRRGDKRCMAYCYRDLAQVATAEGDPQEARRLAARSRKLFQELRMGADLEMVEGLLRGVSAHG